MHVVFVCSNDTHVRMFLPVAQVLGSRSVAGTMLSLDVFYGQGATAAARDAGLEVLEPRARNAAREGQFYRRWPVVVWRDVLRARAPMEQLLKDAAPDVLVLGNDTGLIEKLALHLGRGMGVRGAVLVQDGRIVASRPRARGPRQRVLHLMKRAVSPVLTLAGLPYLASSEYGQAGVDVICATGPRSAKLLSQQSRGAARVIVTGQPRYDGLASLRANRPSGPGLRVVVFTTPFEAAGLGVERQRRQMEMVRDLADSFTRHGIGVYVKPHPREDAVDYEAPLGRDAVLSGSPSQALSAGDVAIVGISTVLEEAAILGCPVVVPGRILHDRGVAAALPPRDTYPRFASIEEAMELILGLRDVNARQELAARQLARTREDLEIGSTPASARVAEAILGLDA
ncbi:MAG TPA: hypothetical protein VNL98_04570 [Gemmatimonadales bacterium]|nr:hypothetical protein [Gemmatimonadales bacterium]